MRDARAGKFLGPGGDQETAARDLLEQYRSVPSLDLSQSTPHNSPSAAERVERAWQVDVPWNPHFDYPDDPGAAKPGGRLEQLADLSDSYAEEFKEWTFSQFADFLRRQAAWSAALRRHDAAAITQQSEDMHGSVTAQDREEAVTIIRRDTGSTTRSRQADITFSPEETAAILNDLLRAHGLASYHAGADTIAARMAVSAQHRRVRVNADAQFTPQEIRRLAVHELGCHVARGVCGDAQPKPLLSLGIGRRHLHTEEGLAVWLENACGVLSEEDQRKYALRVLAVDTARCGSFYDVYGAVREHTTADQAYVLTLRVKRGLTDTTEAGGYLKDHVYLSGWRSVDAAVGTNRSTLEALSVGKVSLDQVSAVGDDLKTGSLQPGGDLLSIATRLLEHADDLLGRHSASSACSGTKQVNGAPST